MSATAPYTAFPNDFRRNEYAGDLQAEYADPAQWTAEALEANGRTVRMAGRLMAQHSVDDRADRRDAGAV